MKKFFSKRFGIKLFLCSIFSLSLLAGCKPPVESAKSKLTKVEFVQPANGKLTAKVENGKAIKTGDSFAEGTKIVFTATPNKDYELLHGKMPKRQMPIKLKRN